MPIPPQKRKSVGPKAGVFAKLRRVFGDLRADQRGSIAILFAVSAIVLVTAIGAGVDLARAYQERQKLSEVAMLGCQYATRTDIIAPVAASNAGTTQNTNYVSAVTSYVNTSLTNQRLSYSQTNTAPFTYTPGGAASVSLSATVPTEFMQIVHVNSIPVSANSNCYTTVSEVYNSTSPFLVQENFETQASGASTWWLPNGTSIPDAHNGTTIAMTTTFNTNNIYTGGNGAKWVIMGYCVETDALGNINSTIPGGSTSSGELDCDNGSATGGDSSISNKEYLNIGEYEVRYWFKARVAYPDYQPAYICGSSASDVSWATDSNSASNGGLTSNAVKNNQVDVFLDADNNNSAPTHLINDGTMSLAGSNLIDSCVYSYNWIQRSIRIYVTTPGFYWLSFAADGANNSYGGQLATIQWCYGTCSGTLQDNFPFTANQTLFEDTFENPVYSGTPDNTNGNLNNSVAGTYIWGGGNTGWANAPTNELPVWTTSCPQGNQCVELGWNTNSLIGRGFLLDPGYYQVSYKYEPEITFAALNSVYCGATPSAAGISTLSSQSGTGVLRYYNSSFGGITYDTNTVGVFMSHAQEASTPNIGNALGSTTSYTNPNGTTSTTPTVPPNAISLTNYNSSQVNPLLDICGYAPTAQTRTAVVYIQKPAYYWLTLAALGTSDWLGGIVDDVKITALNSPYNSTYASSAITIPVPAPQPSATVSYSGFYITADTLTPPAP
jgi:Flp pilus assembly protein TadG